MSSRPQSRPFLQGLPCYIPGERPGTGSRFRLASNENPYGCSQKAKQAFTESAATMPIYPDGGAIKLCEAIGENFGLDPARIICGAGSDEIFHMLVHAYLGGGERIVQSYYAFLVYALAARQVGGFVAEAPEPDFCADIDAMLELAQTPTRIVFLANPNNPTGSWLKRDDIARLHAGLSPDTILVLDCAYAEYVTDPDYDCGFALAREAENIIVTRTFSKIHGLAGLRVGWAYTPLAMIGELHKVRPPFNVSAPAQAGAIAALSDTAFIKKSAKHNAQQRDRLYRGLSELGLSPVLSQANFILANFDQPARAQAAKAHLDKQKIRVRDLTAYRLPQCLRITIGTTQAVDAVLAGLGDFIRS